VKVCGITDAHDAELAASSGAAFLGLVMVPNTPRALIVSEAEQVAAGASETPLVGVFRNQSEHLVAAAARRLGLHAVQLHGREDAAYIAALRPLLPPATEIWAAAAVDGEIAPARAGADRTLFDTALAGQSGGTGRTFDWARLHGRSDVATGLLAGGLNATNAPAAARVGAYALDVSSGVEAAPGRKDAHKLGGFFQALRAPSRSSVLHAA
jgi:indole-3-glycerol phosphate synthase/phosphoribosylanthranilate isomerase